MLHFRLMRKTPMKRANPKRRAAKYERNFSGGIGHDTWIRAQPCALDPDRAKAVGLIPLAGDCSRPRRVEAAHAKARGMGGCGGTWRDLVPLCRKHHGVVDDNPLFFKDEMKTLAHSYLRKHEDEIKQNQQLEPTSCDKLSQLKGADK